MLEISLGVKFRRFTFRSYFIKRIKNGTFCAVLLLSHHWLVFDCTFGFSANQRMQKNGRRKPCRCLGAAVQLTVMIFGAARDPATEIYMDRFQGYILRPREKVEFSGKRFFPPCFTIVHTYI